MALFDLRNRLYLIVESVYVELRINHSKRKGARKCTIMYETLSSELSKKLKKRGYKVEYWKVRDEFGTIIKW